MDEPQNGDALSFFTPGQRFVPNAQTLNAWQEAARAVRGEPGATGGADTFAPPLKVRVKNTHTSNVSRGQVLKITGPVFDPTGSGYSHVPRDAPYLNVAQPATDFQACVIAAEPIPTGKTGWAYVAGVCWAKVNFAAAGDRYAYCKSGQVGYLQSHPVCGNARVLWPASGTGTLDALVILHNDPQALFPATIKTNWTTGTTADLYAVGDTATTITATAWGCTFPLDTAAKVLAFFHAGTFYFLPMAEVVDDVFTDVELDSENNKLQFKKRGIRASFTTAETSGAYVLTSECP